MNNIIRVGLFGASNILERVMGEAFFNHPNFIISGIASNTSNKLDYISDRFNCPKYNSYDDLICSNKIDAAYISLPNSMHYEISKNLLNKGIHCLVEKPMTCSEFESIEINNIAMKNDLAIVETFQFQYHSQFMFIKKIINDHCYGDLRSIDIKFGFPLLENKENIRYKRELKGGAFFDVGVYIAKTACLLTDTVNAKIHSNINYLTGYEVDMYGSCLIKSKDEISILGSWGFDHNYTCSINLWLSKANLVANRIFTAKNDFVAKVEVLEQNNRSIFEFVDDQYYNTLNEFFSTINYKYKRNEHYSANLLQANVMQKIYPF